MNRLGTGIRWAGFLAFALASPPVAAAHFWVDSRFDLSQEHYHGPEEACIVGELARRTNIRQENGDREYRWGAAYVGPEQGLGERVCRGVIYGRFFAGGTWLPVELVDTLVYEVGSADTCSLPNYTDPETGQCGPPKCTDECCVGCGNGSNPIHSASGNKHQVERDFEGAGPFPLRFERVYDSQRILFNRKLPLGVGWTHSYRARVYVVPNADAGGSAPAKAYVYRPDGRVLRFTRSGSNWTSDPDVSERLTVTLSGNDVLGATLTTNDDVVESYDAQGRPVSLTNRDGFVQTLRYTTTSGSSTVGHNEVQTVTDPTGRVLIFTYDAVGALSGVTDGNAKTITYGYTSGNLTSATYPDEAGTRTRTYAYNESGQTGGVSQPNALTGIVDETGQRHASWGYDASGRANLSVHGPFSTGTIDRIALTFNAGGTTTVVDALGQSRTFGFDAQYLVARLTALDEPCDYCAGAAAAKTYDANGYPQSARDFRDTETVYTYDSRGLETQRIEANTIPNPSNPSTRITPDEKRTINTTWNANFRVPERRTVVNRLGTTEARTDWAYNARGQAVARCDYDVTLPGLSDISRPYTCSASGTPPAGIRRWTYAYCDAVDGTDCPLVGLVRTVNGPRTDVGDVTTYAYRMADDPATPKKYRKGDLWKVTNALGHVTEYQERDGNGRPTKVVDANGVVTQMTYHPRGWLLTRTVVAPAGGGANATTTIAYDDAGNVTRVTQPDGAWLAYTYDLAHRLVKITDNLGDYVDYCPGGAGSATCLDALGNRRIEATYGSGGGTPTRLLTRTFDTLSRLRDQYNAQNDVTHFDYDDNGNRIEQTDPTTVKTRSVMDPLNRLQALVQDYQGTDPDTADTTTAYVYDARDNLREVTDPDALATNYTFDGLGNLRTLDSPDTGATTYTYDAAGNRTQQTDARGVQNSYTYDALNRLTHVQYSPTKSASYFYDEPNGTTGCPQSWPKGRLTRMTDPSGSTTWCYDHRGNVIRKTQVTPAATLAVGYAYTVADRLAAIDYPEGVRAEYTRDALGRITAVKVRPGATGSLTNVVTGIAYRPFGPAATYTFAAGSQSLALAYDQNYWVTDVAGSVLNLHFCRDAVGNLTRLKAAAPACTGTPTEQYGYDALYRLTDVRNGAGGLVEGYAYNPTGDRLGKTVGSTTTPYTYAAGTHHLIGVCTQTRDFDAAGNLIGRDFFTETFEYDERNRYTHHTVVGFGGGTLSSYEYNARGERVRKGTAATTPPTRTDFVYDEGGRLLTEQVTELGGGSESLTGTPVWTHYVYADDRPVALVRSGTLYYVHSDHLGTPRAVTPASSATPVWSWSFQGNPFGEQAPSGSLTVNVRFPGQYYDIETGLHYNYFRDYEPATGRYIQTDPSGLGGGIATYAYALNSPSYFFDSLGLAAECLGCDSRVTSKKVQQWCDRFTRRIKDASLASCVKGKCETGQVRCKSRCLVKCEGQDNYSTGGFAGLSRKGDNHIILCMDTDPSRDGAGGGWGAVIVHEFAHTCGWMHCDGGGVPRDHTSSECRRAKLRGTDPQGGVCRYVPEE